MQEKTYETPSGVIHYWIDRQAGIARPQLVFLPGLMADHRLFDDQIACFRGRYPLLTWDAPGHSSSRPFRLDFSLADKAGWLEEILCLEGFDAPVIIGQSIGGYLGQAFMQRFPGRLKGFVSIDSAPLQKRYVTDLEIGALKRMEPMYRLYPWKALLRDGSNGVAATRHGRALMRRILMEYEGDKRGLAALAGHGFRMIAEAMEADLPYEIDCQALLICGTEDRAGLCRKLTRQWHERTGIPLEWIACAGHNSNTDQPEIVNHLLNSWLAEQFDHQRR